MTYMNVGTSKGFFEHLFRPFCAVTDSFSIVIVKLHFRWRQKMKSSFAAATVPKEAYTAVDGKARVPGC